VSAFWQRRDAGFSIPKGFERGIRIIPRNMQYSFSWYVGKMDSAIFDLKAGIIHVHQDPLSPLNENHCAIPSERLDMPTCHLWESAPSAVLLSGLQLSYINELYNKDKN